MELSGAADRAIATYSKGMRQRAKMAAALVHDPAVLVLDEPFNGMDPRQRLHMMDLLRALAAAGRTILFSSHILEEVERVAERVLVVVAGRLAASGDFREIRRLMTDRPHAFRLRTSDDRVLAAAIVARPTVAGVALEDGRLIVRADGLRRLHRRARRDRPGCRGLDLRADPRRRVPGVGLRLPGARMSAGAAGAASPVPGPGRRGRPGPSARWSA